MKYLLKFGLKYYLKALTKLALIIHKPTIIAVAGSINKPFIKQEIKPTLEKMGYNTRTNPKNFNTEIGLPLAVLDLPSGYNSYRDWLPAIKQAPQRVFSRKFPEYLVLGLGSSDPGDMKYLLSIIKPQVAVITDITQRYIEGFSDMDEMVAEYTQLAQQMDKRGLLIYNQDNHRVREVVDRAVCQTRSFGFSPEAAYCAENIQRTENGQKAKIRTPQRAKECHIHGFGKHRVYAFLVANIIKDYAQEKSS